MTSALPQPLPLDATLQRAIAHHQARRLQQAEQAYRSILQIQPNHPDANHNLGVLAGQVGQRAAGLPYLKAALAINPSHGQYALSYASALLATGQAREALSILQSAMQRGLDNPAAQALRKKAEAIALSDTAEGEAPLQVELNQLVALYSAGRYAEVENRARLLVGQYPDSGLAWKALGASLQMQGKDDLLTLYKATELMPDDAEVHNNLGNAQRHLDQIENAIESFCRALEIMPDFAEAHSNLGNALRALGQLESAVSSYRLALDIKPDFAEAHSNLGNALRDQHQLNNALASYRRALEIRPDFAVAHNNLGAALQDLGQLDNAVASYRRALEIKPDYAEAHRNLLFLYSYHSFTDPHDYLAQARTWEQSCVPAQDREAARHRVFQRPPLTGRRLRVGYVSGDYRQHAISYFVEQLFIHHDRARIELFAYSTGVQCDAVTQRLQALAPHWVPIAGIADATILERIEADGIDVLIDLSGHTMYNRLGVFARRAAPVQAHYLGYFASTGLTEMDYWIGDDILTPARTNSHFREQVWRLPRVWVSYEGKAAAPIPAWRPSEDGAVWLGSFNTLGKLTPATLALWAKVLHALPEGKLLLKTKELSDIGNRERILEAMSGYGILSERIELQDRRVTPDWSAHMAYYDRLDIVLDPVGGVCGGTTTCDALWMGAPIITLEGDRMASRMSASMLGAIGHPEWVARSEAQYVDKVVALARDVKQRKALRSSQRKLMSESPLCDAHDLARSLENAYFAMFERYRLKRDGDPAALKGYYDALSAKPELAEMHNHFGIVFHEDRLGVTLPRTIDHAFYPRVPVISLELTNNCNLKCPYCANGTLTRPKTYIEWALLEKIIDECAEKQYNLAWLHGVGEPLLWDRLEDVVALIRRKGAGTGSFGTNGTLLRPVRVKRLLDAGLDSIYVSIDTLDPEIYRNTRGGKLEKVIHNIQEMIRIVPRSFQITVALMNHKDHHITGETIKQFHQIFGHHENVRTNLVENQLFPSAPGDYRLDGDRKIQGCLSPVNYLFIALDGRAAICCIDQDVLHSLGNVTERSITDIWFDPGNQTTFRNVALGVHECPDVCTKKCVLLPPRQNINMTNLGLGLSFEDATRFADALSKNGERVIASSIFRELALRDPANPRSWAILKES